MSESIATPKDPIQGVKSQALQAAEELRAAAAHKAQQLKDVAQERVQHLREVAGERVQHLRAIASEKSDHLRDVAEEHFTDARERIGDWQEETERYVRENPTKSVLIALGVGFLVGRLFR